MKISCPHCGQHFDVDDADVGKEADCINCGKRFTLQSTVAPAAPAQQPPPSSETGETLDSEAFDETDPETEASPQGNHAEIDKIVRRYLRPGDDETVRRALEVVILDRKASTSYLQRRLGIGYNRAAEIMDLMEERGIVGPPSGSGNSREILLPPLEEEPPPKMEHDPPENSSAPIRNVGTDSVPFFDEETKGCVSTVFFWIRKIVSVICVIVAMYQMYSIQDELKENLRYEDSSIRAVSKKTRALVDLMQPVMFMLLAIFIKPGDKNEK